MFSTSTSSNHLTNIFCSDLKMINIVNVIKPWVVWVGVLYHPSILLMKSKFHFRCFAAWYDIETSIRKISGGKVITKSGDKEFLMPPRQSCLSFKNSTELSAIGLLSINQLPWKHPISQCALIVEFSYWIPQIKVDR